MGKARVLILGHSFIRRLHAFLTRSHDNEYTTKLGISTPDFIRKWHGVGGRTVAKVLKYDLKDPSQARLCYCFDLKFAIRLLVERDKTSAVQLVNI